VETPESERVLNESWTREYAAKQLAKEKAKMDSSDMTLNELVSRDPKDVPRQSIFASITIGQS